MQTSATQQWTLRAAPWIGPAAYCARPATAAAIRPALAPHTRRSAIKLPGRDRHQGC